MNDESKFELTWIQREGHLEPQPSLRFDVFDQDRAASIGYEAVLWVCASPRCPCRSVLFSCRPLLSDSTPAPQSPAREFWLDVAKRTLQTRQELSSNHETLRFAEVVRTKLTDAAWGQLYQWFCAAKLEVIQTAKVEEIETNHLPNADDGQMIGFVDVFPLGLALYFPFGNEHWAVDEQYCVQSGCPCTETVLSFLQYEHSTGRNIVHLPNGPALRYNYRSHVASKVEPGPVGAPAARHLLGALKAAHPSLDQQLEFRHLRMQSLYARRSLAEAIFQRPPRPSATVPVSDKKVGRNDPCPCGSGKKFKKCCGR